MLVRENGRNMDVDLRKVTSDNFIVPKGEEHLYHCRIEMVRHSAETGKYISSPRIQVFGRKYFETSGLHNLRKQGYKVDILHNPKQWMENEKAKAEEERKIREEYEAKAEEERRNAEREALKNEMRSEILEELKKEGIINVESTKKSERSGKEKKSEEK